MWEKLVFQLSGGGKIKIAEEAFARIIKYIQVEDDAREAGGVLIGRFLKDSENIVIDRVTVPMIGDIRTRRSFKRAKHQHQKIIDRCWVVSNGTSNYLGEWHTHPEKRPVPSNVDLSDWKRQLKQDTFSGQYLYFVIAGTVEIGVWEGNRQTYKIKKLKPL